MSQDLRLERHLVHGVPVGRVVGDLDYAAAAVLRSELSDHVTPAHRGLVLDLSSSPYVDSAGVHMLVQLGQVLAAHRQQLRIVVPPGHPVRRIVLIAGLDAVLAVDTDLDAAIAALGGWRSP